MIFMIQDWKESVKDMKRKLAVLLCVILLIGLIGCGKNGDKEDLNVTASELLRVSAEKLGLNIDDGIPDNIIVVTYDLTAFKDMPTEEFQEWVLEECVGENVEVVIVTDVKERWESDEQAKDYLRTCGYSQEEIWNAEWTDFRFYFEEDTSQLSSKETILFDIVYRTYQNEGVGKAISCRYKDGEWIVVDLEETWRS